MSSDFGINKNRIDIAFGFNNGPGVHKTWKEVIKAVRTGETFIKTSLLTLGKYPDRYDDEGRCVIVGVYENYFCREIKKLGIKDIRYGSTCNKFLWSAQPTHKDNMYTLYR